MDMVFPEYYKDFKCIAGACRHSCCIGWEIDIDADTAAFYASVPGELGARLRENISAGEEPHFILGEGERCPFLNDENLCDLILQLGEEHLCGICTDHPRFRNELPGRIESGLGLTCEEAARLILGRKTPMRLVGARATEDDFILARDAVIGLLQDREKPIPKRVEAMLALCGAATPHENMTDWAEMLLSLERLEEGWTALLELLRDHAGDPAAFDILMASRQTEYEQLLVYLVYRHLANACDGEELAARASFAAFGWMLLRALGAALYAKNGSFTFEDQVELARLFSSEIEYSDENLPALLEAFMPDE